jgi:osmotically-inducible protein OsmY
MLRKQPVPDKTILKKVNQRLMRSALGSGCHVTVTVQRGQVLLAGSIQYENQRRSAVRAASSAEGVKNVVDRMQVTPRASQRQ